jgi:hypothetical protein
MAKSQTDPMKDPEFQKVVQTFLRTPPQPRKPGGKKVSSAKKMSTTKTPKGR